MEQRVAIGAAARSCIVAVFDLVTRDVIWLDLVGNAKSLRGGNNVASNRYNIRDMVEVAVSPRLLSLHDLFSLHAAARGTLVNAAEAADRVLDLDMAWCFEQVLADFMA